MAQELDPGIREGTCGAITDVEGKGLVIYWPCSLTRAHDGPHEAYDHDDNLLCHWPVDPPHHKFILREQ